MADHRPYRQFFETLREIEQAENPQAEPKPERPAVPPLLPSKRGRRHRPRRQRGRRKPPIEPWLYVVGSAFCLVLALAFIHVVFSQIDRDLDRAQREAELNAKEAIDDIRSTGRYLQKIDKAKSVGEVGKYMEEFADELDK